MVAPLFPKVHELARQEQLEQLCAPKIGWGDVHIQMSSSIDETKREWRICRLIRAKIEPSDFSIALHGLQERVWQLQGQIDLPSMHKESERET